MKKKNIYTVCVHNGVFHADDVICVSLLRFVCGSENVMVIRSRNPKDFEEADYILDVGGKREYSSEKIWLDHHQDINEYPNGVRRSACGYLFDFLLDSGSIELSETEAEQFRSKVLYPVEAQDNGQDLDAGLELMPHLFQYVSVMNPCWTSTSNGDKEFLEAVDIADKIITSVFTRIWSAQLAENIVEEAINNFNNGIVELPRYCPWQDYVIAHNSENGNRIKFVFWYDTRGEQYMAQGVPVSTKTRETLASFPENIRGKTAEEINEICGTNSATFVHPTGFLGGWKNKEDLVKVLRSILK